MPTLPPHSAGATRVITLTTPPMASEPYSDDIGPRTTSMRSIIDSGGRPICLPPSAPLVFTDRPADTGRPSTRNRV